MLPGLDGVTVCRAIRRDSPNADTPILMLTARREESDKVLGLDSGADDYLTKPFGIRELLARVRALLRRGEVSQARAAAGASTGPVSYKHIRGRSGAQTCQGWQPRCRADLQRVRIAVRSISNPGIVFSRESLLSKVWKDQTFVTVRSVDTLVKRLRKKIESQPAEPETDPDGVGGRLQGGDV